MSDTHTETVDANTPPTEWLRLTDNPVRDENALAVFDAGDSLVTVRTSHIEGVVSVKEQGEGAIVKPRYDRAAADSMLESEFGLDGDEREAVLDRYEELVSELIELDLYDPLFETPYVEGTAYLEDLSSETLAEEVRDALEDYQSNTPVRIADAMGDWWEAEDSLGDVAESFAAADVTLSD